MLGREDEWKELTPQKRKEREEREEKQRQEDVLRGRKILRGMLIFYIALQVFSMVFGYLAVSEESRMGNYIFRCTVRVAIMVVLVRGLWRGRERMRVVFAVLLVLAMVFQGKEIIRLALFRESPPMIAWSISEEQLESDPSGTKSLFDYEEEKEEAMAEYREWEKARTAYRRRMIAAHAADLILCAGFLYILYGCHPVKEYFGQQVRVPNPPGY